MNSKNSSNRKIYGVIGAGSFGTAMSNIIAENGDVLIYARRKEVCDAINVGRENRGQKMKQNIRATNDLQEVCESCNLIFPVVPSANFRQMMKDASPFLNPHHLLIHCTKGLNVTMDNQKELQPGDKVRREHIRTMTDIMREESIVIRLGCLSGPNLAREIAMGQPAATVVASRFKEVVEAGKVALKSPRFRVYGSYDVIGVELAGVLKNVMAIASGILYGLGMGENAKAMLITRGLSEIVKLGTALGADTKAFFGLAGIGDLIATCSSTLSRNFTVGHRLAKGEKVSAILDTMNEVAEGVKTVKMAKGLVLQYGLESPIVDTLFNIIYQDQSISDGIQYLMNHSFDTDVDFL